MQDLKISEYLDPDWGKGSVLGSHGSCEGMALRGEWGQAKENHPCLEMAEEDEGHRTGTLRKT